MQTPTSIRALFSLPGFVAAPRLVGVFRDRSTKALVLRRRKKTARGSQCQHRCCGRYDKRTCRARDLSAGGFRMVSATVLADTSMRTDAWATAFQVLGPERGMAIAERIGLPVLFIIERDGQFEERVCCAFQRYRRQEMS